MTDGQIKAMFTLLEYIAKMVVDKRKDDYAKLATELQRLNTNMEHLRAQVRQAVAFQCSMLNDPEAQRFAKMVLKDYATSESVSVDKQPNARTWEAPDYWKNPSK